MGKCRTNGYGIIGLAGKPVYTCGIFPKDFNILGSQSSCLRPEESNPGFRPPAASRMSNRKIIIVIVVIVVVPLFFFACGATRSTQQNTPKKISPAARQDLHNKIPPKTFLKTTPAIQLGWEFFPVFGFPPLTS